MSDSTPANSAVSSQVLTSIDCPETKRVHPAGPFRTQEACVNFTLPRAQLRKHKRWVRLSWTAISIVHSLIIQVNG